MHPTLPIAALNKYLSSVLPVGWQSYETETIFLELQLPYSELLSEKINLIKVLHYKPELFYSDVIFFLHACEVINNNVTDFTSIPHINSLEAAKAIVEMADFQGILPEQADHYDLGIRLALKDILVEDGYSHTIWPFNIVGITGLVPGATDQDMKNKELAIKEYISGNHSQPTN